MHAHTTPVTLVLCVLLVVLYQLNPCMFSWGTGNSSSSPTSAGTTQDAARRRSVGSHQQLAEDAPVPSSSPAAPSTLPERLTVGNASDTVHRPAIAAGTPPPLVRRHTTNSTRRYIVPIETIGGLSNQRAVMLLSLMTAVHWGVRDVLLSNAILKLHNIQVELPVHHRYHAPYDTITLTVAPNSCKAHRGWVCAGYAGTFGELFDEAHFRAVVAAYNLTVWHTPFGGYQGYAMARVLPAPARNVRILEQRVVPFSNWAHFWADKDVLSDYHSGGDAAGRVPLQPFTPHVPVLNASIDATLQRQRFTLAKTAHPTALLLRLETCFTSPFCMQLAKAFEPSPVIVARFVEPLLALLPKTFIAVHYREFDCERTARGIMQLLPHLAWHIQYGRFPGITQVPSPGDASSSNVSNPVTLYMSTAVESHHFWPLSQAGYRVVNKEILLGMNAMHYPFEVMAQVDFEICRRATHFASLTLPLRTYGARGSTFSAFLDIYRNLSGMHKMYYFGQCKAIIEGKKK